MKVISLKEFVQLHLKLNFGKNTERFVFWVTYHTDVLCGASSQSERLSLP